MVTLIQAELDKIASDLKNLKGIKEGKYLNLKVKELSHRNKTLKAYNKVGILIQAKLNKIDKQILSWEEKMKFENIEHPVCLYEIKKVLKEIIQDVGENNV